MIGDALITDIKNLPIGVLTADCAPVLILDYKKKVLQPFTPVERAYKNILIKVLNKLVKSGCNKKYNSSNRSKYWTEKL